MSIEYGDLERTVHPELHIDEFESKMGDNKDVVVVSFKVKGKAPGMDICDFVEKAYDWVLDADVSSGEMSDGDYLVFVELPRDNNCSNHILEMMQDLMNLTLQELEEWRVRYRHSKQEFGLTQEELAQAVPGNAQDYESRYGKKEIDELKTAAGVKVTTKAPKNDFTESLRIAAGIL
jgi:hypothetical protein